MKKLIAILACIALVAASAAVFASCSKQKPEEETTSEAVTEAEGGEITGGWEKAESLAITDEFKTVFYKAVAELDGVDYTPIAYLSSQVVAGKNHCVLCKAVPVVPDAKTTYSILYIYEDLEGNAKVSEIAASEAETNIAGEDVTGGWEEPESPEVTDEAKKALEKACETLTGADYEAVALLSTQVVAGTNYRLLCEVKPVTPDAEAHYEIVTVYADLQGGAEITENAEFSK